MRSLTNSEDSDEMLHNAAFHQSLHYLLGQKQSSGKEIHFIRKLLTLTPQYIQWTIPSLLYQTRRKNLLVHKGLRKFTGI